ncbi:hypothetical protein TPHA_0D02650 [Tetrapisispora phaffii CBS 4417]|uniref:Uncharacterized protein n=1 Tax=Tetrapisispora phaffii (strain ATCC 24235 / CBS 4417 / NBRC 1672 / NRRL Y-8282 / UCD 70-5) TaxID=1071381 RepID=G8BST1_TETPH|nr:hypothetical protein TPHA_0D02650 [Tetrapisispora phaffii CBS 4417]CCE62902.1 hypothetical protein TPHA_0D02650 [Tetrapisispora phaffii CBS 4417]
MEANVCSPIQIFVTSSDKDLVPTSFVVTSHPASSALRLLQYIHFKIYEQLQASTTEFLVIDSNSDNVENDISRLGHVSEYRLVYKQQTLRLSTSLKDLSRNHIQTFLKIQIEKSDKKIKYLQNLNYNLYSEFNNLRIKLVVNLDSKASSFLEIIEDDIPLKTTLNILKSRIIADIRKYETVQKGKTDCGIKSKHIESDLTELRINGKKNTIYLNESQQKDLYNDLTLGELLEFDYSPSKNAYFVMEYKMIHGKNRYNKNEYYTIHFNTDVQLLAYTMQITDDTTVDDIKDYICEAYSNALRLYHRDISLYYKGHRCNSTNAMGEFLKVTEYIENPNGAHIDVVIEQEFIEPGPGFWAELFNSPYRFNFMHSGSYWDPHGEENVPNSSDNESRHNISDSQSVEEAELNKNIKFITELGSEIVRKDEYYIKCTTSNNEEVYVKEENLTLETYSLEVEDGKLLNINNNNVNVFQNEIYLESKTVNMFSKINDKSMDVELEVPKLSDITSLQSSGTDYFSSDAGESYLRSQDRRSRRRATSQVNRNNKYIDNVGIFLSILRSKYIKVYPILIICLKTSSLIFFNILFPIYIIYQTEVYFSRILSISISLFLIFKMFISGQEIIKLWRKHLIKSKILNDTTFNMIIRYIREGKLSSEFYINNKDNFNVIDILLTPSLKSKRHHALLKIKQELGEDNLNLNNIDDLKNLKVVFNSISVNKEWKKLLDSLYISWIINYRKQIEENGPEDINDFIILLYQEINGIQLPI